MKQIKIGKYIASMQKEQSELDSHHREEVMNRINELQRFIAGQETGITEFDEAFSFIPLPLHLHYCCVSALHCSQS